MLAALLGFIAPFLPDLINLGKTKLDQIHEYRMMELTLKGQNQQAAWKMDEVVASGDTRAFEVAHQDTTTSYGVKLLDAGRLPNGGLPWYLIPVAWLFTLVDFLNATIKPGITLWFLGFYLTSKWARVQLAVAALSGGDLNDNQIWANALTAVWDQDDKEMLQLIIGFWFGKISRSAVTYAKL